MLVWSEVQVQSAMPQLMSKLVMHSRCLTKCQGHLDKSWSGQKLQMEVSLDVQEGGVVGWSNAATC